MNGMTLTNRAGMGQMGRADSNGRFDPVPLNGLATRSYQLGGQVLRMLYELFGELLDGDVGFIRITSDNPVCALALQFRGLSMFQVPIAVE